MISKRKNKKQKTLDKTKKTPLHTAEEHILDFRWKPVTMQVTCILEFTGLACRTKTFVWFVLLWRGHYRQYDKAVQFWVLFICLTSPHFCLFGCASLVVLFINCQKYSASFSNGMHSIIENAASKRETEKILCSFLSWKRINRA